MRTRKTTAILLSYKRHQNLREIVANLNATGLVDEVIIWNNNPEVTLRAGPEATIINSSANFRAIARYGAALLAKNDTILFQDDDVMYEPEGIVTLHHDLHRRPDRIYGFRGRMLDNGRYTITAMVGEVDIVLGQFMLFTKELLASVYGDLLRLSPFDRGDDIAFSLLTGARHLCRSAPKRVLGWADRHALWRDPEHLRRRQEMVDRVQALLRQKKAGSEPERSTG
jgi:hypothetical protein